MWQFSKKQALNMPQVHRARLRPSLTGWVTGWVFTFSCAHKKKRPGYVPLNPIYIYKCHYKWPYKWASGVITPYFR